ncbi:MAG: virulence factor Mce [Nocardioides sp.]|nr:virulence factor Mce [Nocardioides sp.]
MKQPIWWHPRVLGTAFLALLVLSVYLTYAVFTKKFTDYEEVTLETSTIGLQLPERGDVKVRGVIIGEVLDFEPVNGGESAEITLGLFPDKLDTMSLPENVTGSIVPKTLFGEKYVSLVLPDQPQGELAAGDVIERTDVSIEVEKVLSDLYPLLTAVRPGDLNMTLNAIATALRGRGDQIGENLETLDSYLKRFNPEVPALIEDLRLTTQVSDLYDDVLPQVADILDNTIVTMQTLESREAKLNALFQDVASFSDTTRTFLADNEDNLVRVGELSRAQLRVLSRYSTEFPCLLAGVVGAGKLQAEAFRNYKLHIVLETLPRQPRRYTPADKPRVGENRGPNCLHLPNPPWSQANPNTRVPNFDDGVDEPTGKGTTRVAPGPAVSATGEVGGSDDATFYRDLLAPALGVEPEEVGDLGALLVGPMTRGAEVSLR